MGALPPEVTSFPLIDLLSRALEIEDEELRTTGHHYYLPGESGEPYPTVLVADVSARDDEVWLMNVARQRDKIIFLPRVVAGTGTKLWCMSIFFPGRWLRTSDEFHDT